MADRLLTCSCGESMFHELESFCHSGYRPSRKPEDGFIRILQCGVCRNIWRIKGGELPELIRKFQTK